MNDEALAFENVSFSYRSGKSGKQILKGVDLNVRRGEFVSIIGASGSGKSTIFRLITGLENPQSGEIRLAGQPTNNRLGQVGYMPQSDLLMPWRTVRENAALPLEIKGNSELKKVDEMLQEFGLTGYEDKYPGELSGGMRQRVSFLRATLAGSDILLLDEPFSALDALTKLFMQEWLLTQWEKEKKTILFITHDISEALFLSDRVIVLGESPTQVLEETIVPLGRPREHQDADQPEVLKLKETLIERFRKQTIL